MGVGLSIYNDSGNILIDSDLLTMRVVNKIHIPSLEFIKNADGTNNVMFAEDEQVSTHSGKFYRIPFSNNALGITWDVSRLKNFCLYRTDNFGTALFVKSGYDISYAQDMYVYEYVPNNNISVFSGAGLRLYNENGEITFSSDGLYNLSIGVGTTISQSLTNVVGIVPKVKAPNSVVKYGSEGNIKKGNWEINQSLCENNIAWDSSGRCVIMTGVLGLMTFGGNFYGSGSLTDKKEASILFFVDNS